jgi:hypothetical protein
MEGALICLPLALLFFQQRTHTKQTFFIDSDRQKNVI